MLLVTVIDIEINLVIIVRLLIIGLSIEACQVALVYLKTAVHYQLVKDSKLRVTPNQIDDVT